MKLLRRIATGTTTARDAQVVEDIIAYNKQASRTSKARPIVIILIALGFLLLGLSIGGLIF
jgi:hypothetical protein